MPGDVKVMERPGSRLALTKNGELMVVCRPNPKPVTMGATALDVAAFLRTVGITP